jgi:hypothetical protein
VGGRVYQFCFITRAPTPLPPGALVIKQLFLALEKNSEKKFSFFFIEQIVIRQNCSFPATPSHEITFACTIMRYEGLDSCHWRIQSRIEKLTETPHFRHIINNFCFSKHSPFCLYKERTERQEQIASNRHLSLGNVRKRVGPRLFSPRETNWRALTDDAPS